MRIVQPLLPGAPPTSVVGAQLVTGVEPPQRTESRQLDQRRAPAGRRTSGRHEFLEAEHLGATEVLGSPGRPRVDMTDQAVGDLAHVDRLERQVRGRGENRPRVRSRVGCSWVARWIVHAGTADTISSGASLAL
jgi:hypothetical protein